MGGKPHDDTYLACRACGKQFAHDLNEMRTGKPRPTLSESGVLSRGMPGPRKFKDQSGAGPRCTNRHWLGTIAAAQEGDCPLVWQAAEEGLHRLKPVPLYACK